MNVVTLAHDMVLPPLAEPDFARSDTVRRPALVICDGPDSDGCAAELVARGWRVQAVIAPELAAARLEITANVNLIWMKTDRLVDDAALRAMTAKISALNCCVVADVPTGPVLDQIDAAFGAHRLARILCAPSPVERQLAALWAQEILVPAAYDVDAAPGTERIDQLQAEVSRIARLVSQLTAQGAAALAGGYGYAAQPVYHSPPGTPPSPFIEDYPPMVRAPQRGFGAQPEFADAPPSTPRQLAGRVRRLIRQRRAREQFFPADLFADPAWDMLLDLYAARLERQPVSVSSLCIAAAVPATTALRWIKSMTDAGLFLREADPHDGRRIFIALAPDAADAMEQYFASVGDGVGG